MGLIEEINGVIMATNVVVVVVTDYGGPLLGPTHCLLPTLHIGTAISHLSFFENVFCELRIVMYLTDYIYIGGRGVFN
jgi:hypothetical protein